MKLLVFSTDYKPNQGGIAEHTYRIARQLHQKGNEVIVLSVRAKGSAEFDGNQGFKTYRAPNVCLLKYIMLSFYLLYLKWTFRPNYVYCGITHPCAELCWLFRFNYVAAVHGYEVLYANNGMRGKIKTALKILRTYIYSKAHLTIAVSSFTKQKLVESGVNPSKIKVFHNGVDLENFESGDKYDDIIEKHKLADKKIILTVARISEHKGHDMVIRSLPSVIERIPNVVYLIAGRGSHEIVLKSLVRDLNLEDHVIFLGYVSNADLPKLYNTCDVFIMTSRETSYSVEGFGISFIEASACKKPVIGGKSGGIPDAIVDKVTGLVVNPEDSHEIATALTAVLCDTALANEMGENGYRRVKGGLTWDKIVEDIVKTL